VLCGWPVLFETVRAPIAHPIRLEQVPHVWWWFWGLRVWRVVATVGVVGGVSNDPVLAADLFEAMPATILVGAAHPLERPSTG